jgi:hypothetical protein
MNNIKKFLLLYVGIYIGASIVMNLVLGPVGFSEGYLEEYGDAHDRYNEAIREPGYKRWTERSDLVQPDEALAKFDEHAAHALTLLERETEDRKKHKVILARHALKEALVDETMGVIVKQYEKVRTPESESALFDQFLGQLGGLK